MSPFMHSFLCIPLPLILIKIAISLIINLVLCSMG